MYESPTSPLYRSQDLGQRAIAECRQCPGHGEKFKGGMEPLMKLAMVARRRRKQKAEESYMRLTFDARLLQWTSLLGAGFRWQGHRTGNTSCGILCLKQIRNSHYTSQSLLVETTLGFAMVHLSTVCVAHGGIFISCRCFYLLARLRCVVACCQKEDDSHVAVLSFPMLLHLSRKPLPVRGRVHSPSIAYLPIWFKLLYCSNRCPR